MTFNVEGLLFDVDTLLFDVDTLLFDVDTLLLDVDALLFDVVGPIIDKQVATFNQAPSTSNNDATLLNAAAAALIKLPARLNSVGETEGSAPAAIFGAGPSLHPAPADCPGVMRDCRRRSPMDAMFRPFLSAGSAFLQRVTISRCSGARRARSLFWARKGTPCLSIASCRSSTSALKCSRLMPRPA